MSIIPEAVAVAGIEILDTRVKFTSDESSVAVRTTSVDMNVLLLVGTMHHCACFGAR